MRTRQKPGNSYRTGNAFVTPDTTRLSGEELFALLEGPPWQRRAACANLPPPLRSLFHSTDWRAQDHARAICAGCSVRQDCYDFAATHDGCGVWGGHLFRLGRPVN